MKGFFKKIGRIVLSPVTFAKRKVEKTMAQAIMGIIRHVLTAFGGGLVANGTITDGDFQAGLGAILTIAGIVWSVISKKQASV